MPDPKLSRHLVEGDDAALSPSLEVGLFDDLEPPLTPQPESAHPHVAEAPPAGSVPDERSQTIGYVPGQTGVHRRDATPSAVFASEDELGSTRPGFGVAQATVRPQSGAVERPLPPPLASMAPHRQPSAQMRPWSGLPRSGYQSGIVEEVVAAAPLVRHSDPWRSAQSGSMPVVQPLGEPPQARSVSAAHAALRPAQPTPKAMPRAGGPDDAGRDEVVFAVGGVRASSAGWPAQGRASGGVSEPVRPAGPAAATTLQQVRSSGPHPVLGAAVSIPRPGLGMPRPSGLQPAAAKAVTPGQPMRATAPGAGGSGGVATAAPVASAGVGKWRGAQGQQLDQALQALLPADTPAAARLALQEALEPLQVAAGTTLVQAGTPAVRALLVVSGELRVDVAKGNVPMQVATLRAGEMAAIDLILGLRNARANVVAQSAALLAVLDQRAFANLERTAPAASTRLLAGILNAEARRVRVEEQSLRELLRVLLPAPVAAPPPAESRISTLGEGLAKLFRR